VTACPATINDKAVRIVSMRILVGA
jgi:hypothetical protein